jgi:Zn-dependent protease with chaperone function
MQLAILFAIVCALAQLQADPSPAGDALLRTLFVIVGMGIAPLVALGWPLRGCTNERRERAALFAWLATIAATLYIVKWPQLVRGDFGLGSWPLVDELLVLVPVVLPLLLLWGALYTAMRHKGRPALSPLKQVWHKARQELAIVLLPTLLVIAALELAAMDDLSPHHAGRWTWLLLPWPVLGLFALPAALRRVWRTSPLPGGPLRDELLAICREERISISDILVWHTPGNAANAAVAGLARWCRYVFLTDGLLLRLSQDEIAAVLRHELAHIRRGHLLVRMLVLALPLVGWVALSAALAQLAEVVSASLSKAGISHHWQVALLVPAALFGYVLVIVGGYSKILEHEADLEACLGPHSEIEPSALASFGQALMKVGGPAGDRGWGNWLHPPLAARLAFLQSAQLKPEVAARFRRRLQCIRWALACAYLVAVALPLFAARL